MWLASTQFLFPPQRLLTLCLKFPLQELAMNFNPVAMETLEPIPFPMTLNMITNSLSEPSQETLRSLADYSIAEWEG